MFHGSVASDFWASAILMEAHYPGKRVSNDTPNRRLADGVILELRVYPDYRLRDALISLLL